MFRGLTVNSEHENARCHLFDAGTCRSCRLLHITPGARLKKKTDRIDSTLGGYLAPETVIEPMVTTLRPWQTRNKNKYVISGSVQSPVIGTLDREFRSADLTECPLPASQVNPVLSHLREIITRYNLAPYDVSTKRGELKGLSILVNQRGTEGILRFVLRSNEAIPRIRKALQQIVEFAPWITVVSCTVQPLHAAIPEGPDDVILTKTRRISERYNNSTVFFGPRSFMQVTHEIAAQLYARIASIAESVKPERMLDLYCGVGAFSLSAAPFARQIIGLEISEDAIQNAAFAAQEAKCTNVSFEQADLTSPHAFESRRGFDLIIVNPPRRGLDAAVLNFLLQEKPAHLLYSSCNPETLARDLAQLNLSYRLKEICPFDMFPLTEHVEVLCWLTRTEDSARR